MGVAAAPSITGSVELLNSIVEHSPTAVFVKDAESRYVLANPALAAQFGKTPEEVLGTTDADHIPWPYAERLLANDREVIETGRLARYEEQIPLDGEVRTYVAVKFPLESTAAHGTGVVGFSTNITDLKQAEDELRENERRFRAFVEATSDVVYQMSPIWDEMRHLEGRQFVADTLTPSGNWLQKYIPVEDWPQVLAAIEEAIQAKGVFELEHRVVRVDGSVGWTFSRAVPILDDDGDLVEWLGAAKDVTRRKELESQVAAAQERLRRELHRTAALKEAASASLVLDTREVAQRVLESLRKSIGISAGVVYRVNEDDAVLQGLSLVGYDEGLRLLAEELPLDEETISGRSVLRDEMLLLGFDDLPPVTRKRAEAVREGDSLWVGLPVHFSQRVIGNLSLVFAPRRVLGSDDLSLLRSLADQLGVAIANAELFEREREGARLGVALAKIDQEMHSTLEGRDFVMSALADGARTLGAQSAAVDAIEDGRLAIKYDWGFSPSISGTSYTRERNPHGMESMRSGVTLAIDDAYHDERVDTETMKGLGIRSVIVSPLVSHGERTGSLYYNFHDSPHRFSDAEVDFVRQVASSLSLAIENAELYDAEHKVADRLQEALLEVPSGIAGVEFSHAYYSASEAARVGGDFYDIFALDDGRVGIVVGDVAGKGLNAAVQTSLAKNTIRAHAIEHDKTPGRILQLANEVLYRWTPTESFVTVFFGILHCRDGRLDYASAGHTTGAVIGPDGVERLPATAPLLGALESVGVEQRETTLDRGDVLFLYTDGLTEARRGTELFGEERLFTALSAMREPTATDVVHDVVDQVMEYTSGRLSDDLAILAVERVDSKEPAAE